MRNWKELGPGIFSHLFRDDDMNISALVFSKGDSTWRVQMLIDTTRLAYINNVQSKEDAMDLAELIFSKVIQK